MSRFITEVNAIVYDCSLKNRITVREDGDGLDLIEVIFTPVKGDGDPIELPWIEPDMARHLAAALTKVADQIGLRKSEAAKD